MAKKKKLNPPQILGLLFIVIIVVGTLLLKLPISTKGHVDWITALFTATSATTLTGLYTVFNGDAFTPFGNTIIALLIQFGGLGIMTFAVLIFLMLDWRISIKQRLTIQEALNQGSFGGIIKLAKRLFYFSFFFEMFFTILLAIRFIPELGWGRGIGYALFHSISSFNSAGFTLWPDGLMRFVGDPVVNLLITALFVIGGIGFTVMSDIWDKKNWRALTLHTKLMIIGTLVINLIAFIIIFLIEFDNPKTFGGLPDDDRLWATYFQALSPRSSGFNTINIGEMRPETLFFTMILMFIGGGSISTAGGIKLTTFICLMMMIFAYVTRKHEPVVMGRSIRYAYIFKALTVTLLAIGVIFTGIFLLLVTEDSSLTFLQIAFEAVSAAGTVGLSTGITPQLSVMGQLVVILLMIFGKLGPLTVVFSLAQKSQDDIRYPKGKIFIG